MNYEKMAMEIDDAIGAREVESTFSNRLSLTKHEREDIITAKLKELLRVPEDLEAAVEKILFVSGHFPRCDLKDGEFRSLALDRCVKRILTEVVAPFCQKPEVPEDLEAAWRNVVPDVIDCLYSLHDPIAQGEVIGKAFTEAVAPLLAERDERIELLETTIHLCSGSCRVDYKYPTPESPDED